MRKSGVDINKVFQYRGSTYKLIPKKNLPKKLKKFEKKALKIFKKIFKCSTKKICIVYTSTKDTSKIGEYVINSSKSYPTILIYVENMLDMIRKDETWKLSEIVTTTIIHELLHYMMEKTGLKNVFNEDEEEEWVANMEDKIWQRYFYC